LARKRQELIEKEKERREEARRKVRLEARLYGVIVFAAAVAVFVTSSFLMCLNDDETML